MLRPGADESSLRMEDFLCNFCRRPWTEDLPMVEGHRGNLVCGRCLTVAYVELVLGGASAPSEPLPCVMCLEQRTDPSWRSPADEEQCICVRCVRQAAGALSKDKESGWVRPTERG